MINHLFRNFICWASSKARKRSATTATYRLHESIQSTWTKTAPSTVSLSLDNKKKTRSEKWIETTKITITTATDGESNAKHIEQNNKKKTWTMHKDSFVVVLLIFTSLKKWAVDEIVTYKPYRYWRWRFKYIDNANQFHWTFWTQNQSILSTRNGRLSTHWTRVPSVIS